MRSQEATIWVSQAQGDIYIYIFNMLSARLPSARLSCQGERVRGLRQGAWGFCFPPMGPNMGLIFRRQIRWGSPFEAMSFTSVPGFCWPQKMWCFLGFLATASWDLFSDKDGDDRSMGGFLRSKLGDCWWSSMVETWDSCSHQSKFKSGKRSLFQQIIPGWIHILLFVWPELGLFKILGWESTHVHPAQALHHQKWSV